MARPQTPKRRRTTGSKPGTSKRLKVNATDSTRSLIIARPTNSTNELASPIRRLPAELLAHILSFLLVKQDAVVVLHNAKSRRWRNEKADLGMPNFGTPDGRKIKQSSLLKILLVSRDFYFAGIQTFYENNTLGFQSATDLVTFLSQTGTDRLRCIQKIRVVMEWMLVSVWDEFTQQLGSIYTSKSDEVALQSDLLESLPALKLITVDLSPKYMSIDREAEAVVSIRARVTGSWPSGRGKINVEIHR